VVRVRSREGEREIVPLADEWDPLSIERKRKKKGGCRLGLLGYWAEGEKLLWGKR
jgi:hypothetical protein